MLLDRQTLEAMSDEDINEFARDARSLGPDPVYGAFFGPLFREEQRRAELRLNRGVDAIRDVDRLVAAVSRPSYFRGAAARYVEAREGGLRDLADDASDAFIGTVTLDDLPF